MTEIGLTEYCLPLANLDFDDLIDRVVKLEKNADKFLKIESLL